MAFPSEPAAQLLGSTGPVHAVTYSASPGSYILTGSSDRTIRLYNPSPADSHHHQQQSNKIPEGRLIQTYQAHGYEVLSIAVTSDNQNFVSSGGDRSVFLWDVTSATTTRRFAGHSSRVNVVKFAGSDDNIVVSGGFDTTVRLWDCRSRSSVKPIQILDEARDAVTALVVRGPEVIVGSVDGRVRGYDVRMGRCTTDVLGASVTSLDLTRDGNGVLVGTLDSKIRLVDRRSGKCLRAYKNEGFKNEELRVQSILGGSERYVLAGDEAPPVSSSEPSSGGEGRVWVWDLLTGRVVSKVRVPWGPASQGVKKVVGRDGKEKARSNVLSCMAWREDGWGDQFCVGGTSGVVTVFKTL